MTERNDKEMVELKPCPFCGERLYKRYNAFVHPARPVSHERPAECYAEKVAIYPDDRDAIAAWNTRSDETEITRLKGEIERKDEALEPFARFFKSEDHDLSPASDNTPVALFKDQQTGEPLAELWISDFRKAYAALQQQDSGGREE